MSNPSITNTNPLADVRLGNNEYESVVIASGQDLSKGSVLGVITLGAATGVFTGTGNPTIGTIVLGSAAKAGDYLVDFSAATAFTVYDPDGNNIGVGSTGAEFSNNHITFTITAGGTAADATTLCTITVANGSGYLKLANSASVDGSQKARFVLQDALDTSATGLNANVAYRVLKSGKVRGDKLVFGGTDTYATLVGGMSQKDNLQTFGFVVETESFTSLSEYDNQ